MEFVSVFPDITKCADFQWKVADFSRTQGVCHVIYINIGSSLDKVYILLPHPLSMSSPEKSHINRIKVTIVGDALELRTFLSHKSIFLGA